MVAAIWALVPDFCYVGTFRARPHAVMVGTDIGQPMVAEEGNVVEEFLQNVSLATSKERCDERPACNSFPQGVYCGTWTCHLKDKVVTASDISSTASQGDDGSASYKAYYKTPSSSLTSVDDTIARDMPRFCLALPGAKESYDDVADGGGRRADATALRANV